VALKKQRRRRKAAAAGSDISGKAAALGENQTGDGETAAASVS